LIDSKIIKTNKIYIPNVSRETLKELGEYSHSILSTNKKINLIRFFEGYPTKTVILDVSAYSKVMNKVESISELFDFFTNSPLEKIKTN